MRRVTVVVLFSLGMLGLTACGQSTATKTAASASMCMPGSGITQTVNTAAYKMVLDIGPREMMYTPAQAQAQHPSDGEVMVRGQMVNMGMGNGASSASARHLEVHICKLGTGQVVTNLAPDITLVDNSANDMTDKVPSAVMRGPTSGVADLHYGNNVTMPPDRHFTVTVAAGGQHAPFHVSTPTAS